MRTECIKTGADVWIESQQCVCHCDAYLVVTDPDRSTPEHVYVFRHLGEDSWGNPFNNTHRIALKTRCHFILNDFDVVDQRACLWLDSACVIIAPMTCVINCLPEQNNA